MGFERSQIWEGLHELKPALLMMVVQVAYAGVNVLYKLAANDGMNLKIIVAYRFVFATAFILPLAFFIERNARPKLTWRILFQAFLCGLFGGSLVQNLYIESLNVTSATFASAMSNLIPAITFILAVSFRLEKLNFGRSSGKAKVLGSLVGIGGAMLLTFYKGVEINIWSTHIDLLKQSHVASPKEEYGNRLLGCLLSVGSGTCYSLWLIIQAKMSKDYPCYYSSTALMSLMALIQTVAYALWTERDLNQWKLGWNIRLLSVAYSGAVASGLMVTMIAWCVHLRGPLFVSIFSPVMLVLVAIAGSLLLDEKLHLGSVLGGVLIVFGLYLVLWGKRKEMKKELQLAPSHSFGDHSESIDIVVLAPTNPNKLISNTIDGSTTTVAPNDLSYVNSSSQKEHHQPKDSQTTDRR
ncbi:WAT1-related protein At1g25270-like [Humulus lupulus]|uniref:WAT1-related protein At1g25270-like n=1 Tax=Humulus lupulus TaxID=3486 RepID=UPI002B418210|nr:WAT1-related protein At1g25270-like [Humulus lupulus]